MVRPILGETGRWRPGSASFFVDFGRFRAHLDSSALNWDKIRQFARNMGEENYQMGKVQSAIRDQLGQFDFDQLQVESHRRWVNGESSRHLVVTILNADIQSDDQEEEVGKEDSIIKRKLLDYVDGRNSLEPLGKQIAQQALEAYSGKKEYTHVNVVFQFEKGAVMTISRNQKFEFTVEELSASAETLANPEPTAD